MHAGQVHGVAGRLSEVLTVILCTKGGSKGLCVNCKLRQMPFCEAQAKLDINFTCTERVQGDAEVCALGVKVLVSIEFIPCVDKKKEAVNNNNNHSCPRCQESVQVMVMGALVPGTRACWVA